MLTYQYRNIILASLMLGNISPSNAFMSSNIKTVALPSSSLLTSNNAMPSRSSVPNSLISATATFYDQNKQRNKQLGRTSLHMSEDNFNESKYTESAWACIAGVTKAAEYYSATTIEAPMLLDIMLNPTKHNAGENADSAKRVTEKVLVKADIDVLTLKQELEIFMSKQPKISGSMDSQKVLGRSMMKVLERARDSVSLLGVSWFIVYLHWICHHHTLFLICYFFYK